MIGATISASPQPTPPSRIAAARADLHAPISYMRIFRISVRHAPPAAGAVTPAVSIAPARLRSADQSRAGHESVPHRREFRPAARREARAVAAAELRGPPCPVRKSWRFRQIAGESRWDHFGCSHLRTTEMKLLFSVSGVMPSNRLNENRFRGVYRTSDRATHPSPRRSRRSIEAPRWGQRIQSPAIDPPCL